jgi:hypothetical protein
LVAVDAVEENGVYLVKKGRVDMYKSSMRLAIERAGTLEKQESSSIHANLDMNLSAIDFEGVTVTEKESPTE